MTKQQTSTMQDSADLIGATKAVDGDGYLYHAAETSDWWRCSSADLEELAELMDSEDEDIRRDAYSHWCAGGPGELIGNDAAARAAGLID